MQTLERPTPTLDTKLLSHVGTARLTRADLKDLPVPPATDTFQPVPHSTLIDKLEEALAFRHIHITRTEFAVSPDGMRMFGLIVLNADYEGVNFAIGLRNSNDKSMRLGMVAGYKVFVCDNMMLAGDFKPLLAKHTKGFELEESLAIGVDRIQRGFQPLREAIDYRRKKDLDPGTARALIYRLFTDERIPVKLLKTVHREFFIQPSHNFGDMTVWALENAFTTALKQLKPIQQFHWTAKLGKFFSLYSPGV
jgi:hypothetical protein